MGLVSLLLSRRCPVCSEIGTALCSTCDAALVRIVPPVCERCGAPAPWPLRRCVECARRRISFSTARAAIVYDDRARVFVGAWKERGRRDLARIAGRLVEEAIAPRTGCVLTFVPGDRDRSLERGHVPAETLARALGEGWGVPVERLLRRVRDVDRQRGLPLGERRRNVAQAFAACRDVPPSVVVIDDVYTTGSTVNACAAALRRAGARRVDVITLARAVR